MASKNFGALWTKELLEVETNLFRIQVMLDANQNELNAVNKQIETLQNAKVDLEGRVVRIEKQIALHEQQLVEVKVPGGPSIPMSPPANDEKFGGDDVQVRVATALNSSTKVIKSVIDKLDEMKKEEKIPEHKLQEHKVQDDKDVKRQAANDDKMAVSQELKADPQKIEGMLIEAKAAIELADLDANKFISDRNKKMNEINTEDSARVESYINKKNIRSQDDDEDIAPPIPKPGARGGG